jgi:hypothetical protein
VSGIHVQDGNVTAITRPKAFEDFNRRTFSRAVRTEHCENFARLNLKIDSLHGSNIIVAFRQLPNVNDG